MVNHGAPWLNASLSVGVFGFLIPATAVPLKLGAKVVLIMNDG